MRRRARTTEARGGISRAVLLERWISLSVWSLAGWILLTGAPFTLEQELFGAGFAGAGRERRGARGVWRG